MQEMLKDRLNFFACPACGGKITLENDFLNCLNCEKKYPIIDGTYSGPQAVRTPKSFKRITLSSSAKTPAMHNGPKTSPLPAPLPEKTAEWLR